ncbi:MAG: ATP-binding protein [Candidatus Marinimicrobia bacterium]|nr:ATP-binding protein [Candidatus Neomarinimicrobiota bacterium]
MDFRQHLVVQVMFRVIALAAVLGLAAHLIYATNLVATPAILFAVALAQVYELIRYNTRTDRDLTYFFNSVRYNDFSLNFPSGRRSQAYSGLVESLNELMSAFRRERAGKEAQYRFMQTVVEHVNMALIAFDRDGEVQLFNLAAKRLLGVGYLRSLGALEDISPALAAALRDIRPGQDSILKMELLDEPMQLALSAVEVRQENKLQVLVSLIDLEPALAQNEVLAWQKLIRVLTHEIMNSITPIASLSGSLSGVLRDAQVASAGSDFGIGAEAAQDLRTGLDTIGRRSAGLLRFVEAYRNLTRLPSPTFKVFRVDGLFQQVRELMSAELSRSELRISVEVEPETLELTADQDLVGQVLINLIKNALDAVDGRDDPQVGLSAKLDRRGKVVLQVQDNGPGISPEVAAQIFIPFFTTKSDGSGIGLAICREIMQMHGSSVTVQSDPGRQTLFTLRF